MLDRSRSIPASEQSPDEDFAPLPDAVVREVAELAGVLGAPDAIAPAIHAELAENLAGIKGAAWAGARLGGVPRKEDVTRLVQPAHKAAVALLNALAAANTDRVQTPEAAHAELILGLRIPDPVQRENLCESLRLLSTPTERERMVTDFLWPPRRRRPSAHPAFDDFARKLCECAKIAGGRLTVKRSDHEDRGFGGSLLKAIGVVKQYLPKGFVPRDGLGIRLYRLLHPPHHN